MIVWLNRLGTMTLTVAALLTVFFTMIPQGRVAFKTAIFISEIVPAIPAIRFGQSGIERYPVLIQTADGPRTADMYRPKRPGQYPATVVFLGVAPAGRDDPRVLDLGYALARSGMVALIYWSPEKNSGSFNRNDVQNLVSAFEFLSSESFVDRERIGLTGFCVGAAFAFIAASHEQIRDRVAFVNLTGPYSNLVDVLRSVGTGTSGEGERLRHWEPDALVENVAKNILLGSLTSIEESEQIAKLMEERLNDLTSDLSPEGAAVLRILEGGTRMQVEEALNNLPGQLISDLEYVSPETYVTDIRSPIFIMHDREDRLIPVEESRRLTKLLQHQADIQYAEFSFFQHVTPSGSLPIGDMIMELGQLYRHIYAIFWLTW